MQSIQTTSAQTEAREGKYLTFALGAEEYGLVSFIGVNKLGASRDTLSRRTANAAVAIQLPFRTIKQYQNQADLIINRNMRIVSDVDHSAEQMDTVVAELVVLVGGSAGNTPG